jgi:FKBP-type peptidyl-prolyl cis-trans isomerase (trigger factor)
MYSIISPHFRGNYIRNIQKVKEGIAMPKRLKTLYIKVGDEEIIQVKENKIRATIANIAEKYHNILNKYKKELADGNLTNSNH